MAHKSKGVQHKKGAKGPDPRPPLPSGEPDFRRFLQGAPRGKTVPPGESRGRIQAPLALRGPSPIVGSSLAERSTERLTKLRADKRAATGAQEQRRQNIKDIAAKAAERRQSIRDARAAAQEPVSPTTTPPPLPEAPPAAPELPPVEEEEDPRTVEERAESVVIGKREERGALEEELFGERITPSLLEEQVEKFKAEQAAQLEAAKAQAAAASEVEQLELAERVQQAEAAKAGTAAALAQGRLGPVSATAPLIVTQFQKTINRRIEAANIRVEAAQARRAEAIRNLEVAQESQRAAFVRKAQAELDNAELEIQRADAEQLEAEGRAAQLALDAAAAKVEEADAAVDRVSSILDFLGDAGIASFGAVGLSGLFEENGLDGALGLAIHAASIQLLAAQEAKDEFAMQEAQVKLANGIAKLADSGKTANIRNFEFLQSIEDLTEREQFRELLLADPRLQFMRIGDDAYSFNPKTGTTNKIVDSTKTNNLVPTGILVSTKINGVNYKLDQAAMIAFTQANEAAIAAGVGPIMTQASATASFRTDRQQMGIFGQGRTVEQLLTKGFSSEEAQEFARPGLNVVTWTTESVHESGLALDIKADRAYINIIKPFLNAKGWKQTATSMGDFGHFEFQGFTTGAIPADIQSRLIRANAGQSKQVREGNTEAVQSALATGDPLTIEDAILEVERKKFLPRSQKILDDFDEGIKDFETIQDKFNQMQAALKVVEDDPDIGFTFIDQALISLFNKITDPTSVVRESEFNRTAQSLGLKIRAEGFFEKHIKGGAGLTPKIRREAIQVAEALTKGARQVFNRELGRAKSRARAAGVPGDFLFRVLGLTEAGEFQVFEAPTTQLQQDLDFFGDLFSQQDISEFESFNQ